jgi:hypothetical protein
VVNRVHEETIIEVVLASIVLARRLRFPHMLVGALAAALWGEPRATTDADLMVQVPEGAWERLKRSARQVGFQVDLMWERYNPLLRDQQVRFIKRGIRVDFIGLRDAHDQQALQRRRFKMFTDRRVAVVAPDDLVIQKLKAGRPRDLDDAVGVLRRSSQQMDHDYLWTWARRFRVTDELAYLLRHASLTNGGMRI